MASRASHILTRLRPEDAAELGKDKPERPFTGHQFTALQCLALMADEARRLEDQVGKLQKELRFLLRDTRHADACPLCDGTGKR